MSRKLITMEQIKQILQLHNDGIGIREIARRTGLSRNSIRKYISRVTVNTDTSDAGLSGKQPATAAYDKQELLADARRTEHLTTHFGHAQKELGKTGVTRQLLWTEYKEQYPDGYNYSRYCHHFKNYLKHTDVVMHLEYEAGDMIMIDFAGKKLRYVDKDTGEVIECEVFVAVLPYSGLIFCEAVHSQQTADFITCINAMLKYYSAVPKTILCDTLKLLLYAPVSTSRCLPMSAISLANITKPPLALQGLTAPGIKQW